MSATTSQKILHRYPLVDGRVAFIMNTPTFRAVELKKVGNILYAGERQMLVNKLVLDEHIATQEELREYLAGIFRQVAGVFLFDFLLKNKQYMPKFDEGKILIFLQSTAASENGEQEYGLPQFSRDPGVPRWKRFLNFFLSGPLDVSEVPSAPVPMRKKAELGFFALKHYQGEIVPWFVSRDEVIKASREQDPAYLMLEVGELMRTL